MQSRFEFFVEPEWLEIVRGMEFYYPAAGEDIEEPLEVFAPYMSRMVFNDISPITSDWTSRTDELGWKTEDPHHGPSDRARTVTRPRYGRGTPTGKRTTYSLSTVQDQHCEVVMTSAYGDALLSTEFEPGRIGVFFHRSDSPGEGGSNLRFWDENLESPPCFGSHATNVHAVLLEKLAKRALVVTDGSLMPFEFTKLISSGISAKDLYQRHSSIFRQFNNLRWRAAGWMCSARRSAVVWIVERP